MASASGYGRHFGYKKAHFGSDTKGVDFKVFGDSTGKYFFWDASTDTFYIAGTLSLDGTFNADNIAFEDDETLTLGTGSDVVIQWDGTNLIIAAAADDSLIEIGDSAVAQKSFDLKWYGNEASGASYVYFDASGNLIYTTGIDLQFKDDDICVFGTGAGASGDVQIVWDGTNLIIKAISDDTLIEIGDSAASQLSFDLKWYGNGANGVDYLYADASRNLIELTNIELSQRKRVEVFDDFLYQTLTEADTTWILNSGNDAQAIDPAISSAECGELAIVTGDADGTVANDGSQIVCSIPMQADSGGLVFETRLKINTAITEVSVNAGFTDSSSLEEPFTNAADVITAVSDDAVCFIYDDGATTKEWFACAVDGTEVDTGNAATGDAPVADTYQTLRIEVSADGATILFYVNGTLTHTLSGSTGVSPDVNLYATIIACATTTTSKTVDVDYIYCGHNR